MCTTYVSSYVFPINYSAYKSRKLAKSNTKQLVEQQTFPYILTKQQNQHSDHGLSLVRRFLFFQPSPRFIHNPLKKTRLYIFMAYFVLLNKQIIDYYYYICINI